jgi:hypothetical protein
MHDGGGARHFHRIRRGHVSIEHDSTDPATNWEVTEMGAGRKKWRLSLHPDFLRMENEKEETEVDRVDLPQRVETVDGLLLRRLLIVKFDKKKRSFQLTPDEFEAVVDWIGPPTVEDLKVTLKRRLGWVLPIGFLFVLPSLIVGIEQDPVSLGLGLTLILAGLLAKLFPSRNFFAVESLWFSFFAANSLWHLLQEWGWLRFMILLLQLSLVRGGWREYRRFAPKRMAGEDDGAETDGRED